MNTHFLTAGCVSLFVHLMFVCAVMSWVCKTHTKKKRRPWKWWFAPSVPACAIFVFQQQSKDERCTEALAVKTTSVKDKMSARMPSVPTAGIMGAGNEMMKEAERMRRHVILPCWRSERGLAEKLKRSDWCPPTRFTRGVSTWWKRNVYVTPEQQTTFGRRMSW